MWKRSGGGGGGSGLPIWDLQQGRIARRGVACVIPFFSAPFGLAGINFCDKEVGTVPVAVRLASDVPDQTG